MNNIVAIVGRPNVGKSTFFNRLIKRREAIVDSVSGVTRDRNYGKSEWNGKEFSVIDTGGYIKGSDDVFESEIRRQVELAIDEADAIIFVVDVEEGITPMDAEVAKLLRKVTKPILLAVNKVDNAMREKDAIEFYNLGLGLRYNLLFNEKFKPYFGLNWNIQLPNQYNIDYQYEDLSKISNTNVAISTMHLLGANVGANLALSNHLIATGELYYKSQLSNSSNGNLNPLNGTLPSQAILGGRVGISYRF